MKKFTVTEYKGQRVNAETGEVYEYSQQKSVIKTEVEPFFLTYSKQILALFDSEVLNATTKVLYKLLEFAEFNTGKVYMTPERVDELLSISGVSRASYHRAIKELTNKGVITKNKGTFTIAENMFWKGDRKVRDEIINSRLMVSFSPVFESEDQPTENEQTT
jgi:hypothetical protein